MALKRVTDNQPLLGDTSLQRVGGRRSCDILRGVSLEGTASGVDLGDSSNYSIANVED